MTRTRGLVAGVLLSAAAAVALAGTTKSAWARFTSADFGFSAEFPGSPQERGADQTVETAAGPGIFKRTRFWASDARVTYTVEAGSPPPGYVPAGHETDFLLGLQRAMVGSNPIHSWRKTRFQGRAAIEFTYSHREGDKALASHIVAFFVNTRVFMLIVTAPGDPTTRPDTQRFLSSFMPVTFKPTTF
jgi:hypothetical protein